jgi:uncharacterized protein YqgV (UPF0045/DUF77 family)
VTDEGVKDTEGFVKSTGMTYAYAYDKGGKLKGWAGVAGIPHAILLDAGGKVVWEGHPGSLPEDAIKKAVTGAVSKPMWEWPASTKDVRAALQKHAYAEALAKLAKLGDGGDLAPIKAAIQGMVTSRVGAMKGSFAEGDLYAANEDATELVKALEGLPEKADAEKVLADIKADKDADKVLKAQKKLAEILDKKLKKREFDAAIADVQKIEKEFAGGFVAKQAGVLVIELKKRKSALP